MSKRRRRRLVTALAIAAGLGLPAAGAATDAEILSGGAATNTRRLGGDAFSQPSATLSFEQRADFFVGNGFFKRLWVTAPGSVAAADGLGPLYNARSCQGCHLKDGRGHPPSGPDDSAVSMFLRLSVPPRTSAEHEAIASGRVALIGEPTYGTQLQDLAIPGVPAEGRMRITYVEEPVQLGDGGTVLLRRPHYTITDLAYGPLNPETMLSPRVAPPMIGLGLLEAIADDDVLAAADPTDSDGDGISGRANKVWSEKLGRVAVGRFGWKAGQATIADQSAGALAGDIGISSPLQPDHHGDCTDRQPACRLAPAGIAPGRDTFEATAQILDLLVFYSRHLAVPARRGVETVSARAGQDLFQAVGCAACHAPTRVTRDDWPDKALAAQTIHPYSDLLLHDMGEGLADDRPEGLADGREWRTAPLWGLGLTEAVNGHTFFLHDGRARNATEAVLWHGGEAERARDAFRALPAPDRKAILAFLDSL